MVYIRRNMLKLLSVIAGLSFFSQANSMEITTNNVLDSKIKKNIKDIVLKSPEKLGLDERLAIWESSIPAIGSKEHKEGMKFDEDGNIIEESSYKEPTYKFETDFSLYGLRGPTIYDLVNELFMIAKNNPSYDWITKKQLYNALTPLTGTTLPYDRYKDIIERRNQLFRAVDYVYECNCFARQTHPFRREVEQQILKYLSDNNFKKDEEIEITEFASGRLFETFITVNLLIEQGYRKITVNCIDLEYVPLIQDYNEIYGSKNMLSSWSMRSAYPWNKNDRKLLVKLIGNAAKSILGEKNEFAEEDEGSLEALENKFEHHMALAQFATYFNKDKDSDVKIKIWGDALDYISACENDAKLKSNIIYAIDYYPWETYHYWDMLRVMALQKNGRAWTVLNDIKYGEEDSKTGIVPVELENYYLVSGNAKSLDLFKWELKDKDYKSKDFEYWPYKIVRKHKKMDTFTFPLKVFSYNPKELREKGITIVKVDRYNPYGPLQRVKTISFEYTLPGTEEKDDLGNPIPGTEKKASEIKEEKLVKKIEDKKEEKELSKKKDKKEKKQLKKKEDKKEKKHPKKKDDKKEKKYLKK